jgi:4-hydroxy-tetrahydrodipicolinate synthase
VGAQYTRADAKAAAREAFTGIWAAATTPFGADGGVDHAALGRDVRHLIETLGVSGIFCGGVMGEFWALTGRERTEVVRTVVDACDGDVPVLAHTGHHAAAEAIELSRDAAAVGADFVVLINPYYPVSSADGLRAWFLEVLDAVDIGVWLFDTSYSGVVLPLDLIDHLADVEHVCGIEQIARGMAPLRELGDRWLHGQWVRERINPVPYIKAWAGLLGMSGGPPRAPLPPLTHHEVEALATDLERAGLLR